MNNRITDIVSGRTPLSQDYGVAFVDLNGLKAVNDKEGHLAGDNLLRAAAVLIRDVFKDVEIFRVGGDEFLILDTKHSEPEFNIYIDKLREASEASNIVKIAVGTCFSKPDQDVRTSMHIADELMYKDKEEYYKKYPERKYRSSGE